MVQIYLGMKVRIGASLGVENWELDVWNWELGSWGYFCRVQRLGLRVFIHHYTGSPWSGAPADQKGIDCTSASLPDLVQKHIYIYIYI